MLKRIFYSLPHDARRRIFSIVRRADFNRLQNERVTVTQDGYSYQPLDQHQCIFVHIPKAAGVSISKTLFDNVRVYHTTITMFQLIFSQQEFDHYFKFTFVRNPWDRVFSAYHFLKKGGMNEQDQKWANQELAPYESFEDFVKGWINQSNIWRYLHFYPQCKFLCMPDTQKIGVDFLGFFENLHEDFQYIGNRLSLNSGPALKHENPTSHKKLDYRDFYTDEMRHIVSEVYAKDIELLGYNFDNSSLAAQLKNRSMSSSA